MGVTKNVSLFPVGVPWMGRFLFLLLGLAFLQPLRVDPFYTLLEEFGLGIGVVCLAGFCLATRKRYWVSPLLLVWGGFAGLLVLSALFVPRVFDAPLFAYAGFWVVGLALTQLGPELSLKEEGAEFATRLAWFLVGLGTLSVLLGVVKHYQLWGEIGRYFPVQRSARMNGAVAQSNLFAQLSVLGTMALLWLMAVRRASFRVASALLLLFGVGLTLSGSRVGLAIYGAFFLLSVLMSWRAGSWRFSWLLLVFGVLLLFVQPLIVEGDVWLREELVARGIMSIAYPAEGALSRGLASMRWSEWPLAWNIFLENLPWGVGPGGYAAKSYAMHFRENLLPLPGLWLHSHNSYLQLWIEFGWLGVGWTLLMGGVVGSALWRLIRLNQPVPAMVLMALLIHSFFEFPLWYMHFFVLGFLVLAVGAEAREVEGKPLLGWGVLGIGSSALVFYGWLFSGLLSWNAHIMRGEHVGGDALKFMDRMAQDPLLKPYALLFYYSWYPLGNLPAEMELTELSSLYRYRPFGGPGAGYCIMLAVTGRSDDALKLRDELVRVNSKYQTAFVQSVNNAMFEHPEWRLEFLLKDLPEINATEP